MRELLLGAVLCAGVNAGFRRALPPREAAVPRLEAETAVRTAGLLSLGMRRLAADLELIRLLVYYGTPEPGQSESDFENGRGHFPEVGPRARRILDLDPSFSYAAFYAAGALAFNLERPDEAIDLLETARKRDPGNTQYALYIGAAGLARKGADPARAVAALDPMLSSPDCPTMLKSMAALMHRRLGHKKRAAEIYLDILETSRDKGYRDIARRGLESMGFHP